MIDGINNNFNIGKVAGAGSAPVGPAGAGGAGASSFADMLKDSINEVSRLQQDATQAADDAVMGKTGNVEGVMNAVQKSDLAFKTLLAIRTKLMEAYDEIKNMPI